MSYKVIAIAPFLKEVKRLIKKYPSLKHELSQFVDELSVKPKIGTPIGNNCFKIRIAISSKGKGKSGGGRIITHVYLSDQIIFLLAIYDKSEQESITPNLINERLKLINQ